MRIYLFQLINYKEIRLQCDLFYIFTAKKQRNDAATVVVKREIIEQKKFDDSLEYHNENSMITTKTESTQDFDEDDEFSHDGYSHSLNSLQSMSLPPTPEPNDAQMWNSVRRPSSKSSSLSVNSGTATSSPPPDRKPTILTNVCNELHSFMPI